MNICFYTLLPPDPRAGGVERVTYNLTEYFRKIGIGVFNLTLRGDNRDSVIPANASNSENETFINDFITRNKIDIIIDQYGTNSLIQHPFIPVGVKIIHCYHLDPGARHVVRSLIETFSFSSLSYSLLNLLFVINTPRRKRIFKNELRKKIFGGVDKIVYLCPEYVLTIKQILKIDSNILANIPNAVDDQLLNLPDYGDNKDKILMWCGRIAHNHKNVLFLPRLWKQLESRHTDWKMIIVGDGIDRQLLEKRIQKYKLRNITITGSTDPFPYYKKAAIFVSPSFNEGYPMVIIEAMAHSCVPVVFNSCPAYSDIIKNGKSGFIVPDMDENAFINACEDLMIAEDRRREMAYNAKDCIGKISLDVVGEKWMNLFKELLSM